MPLNWCERCSSYHAAGNCIPVRHTMTMAVPAGPAMFQLSASWEYAEMLKFLDCRTNAVDEIKVTYTTGVTVTFERIK